MSKLTINTSKVKYSVVGSELVIKYGVEVVCKMAVPNKVCAMKAVSKYHSWFERAIDRFLVLGVDIPNPFIN